MSESGIIHINLSEIDLSKPITMNVGSFTTDYYKWNGNQWNKHKTEQYGLKYTWRFNDKTPPQILSVSAPEGTYKPGEIVPVTVKFSTMVDAEVRFVGDDQTYSAGSSNILTFPYTVKEMDSGSLSISSITAWDYRLEGGYAQSGAYPAPVKTEKNIVTDTTTRQLSGVKLETPDPERAIESVSATLDESDPLNPVLKVGIKISNNEKLTSWLTTKQVDGKLYIDPDVLSVAADGDEERYPIPVGDTITGQVLSVEIPLEKNLGSQERIRIAELYRDNKWMMGKCSNAVTQNPVTFIEEQALSASIAIKAAGTEDDYTFENPDDPVIYVQSDMPSIRASIELNGTFTFGDKNKTAVDGTEETADADFVWKSSNPAAAVIDKDGNITPTGVSGTTEITLTARNGGVEEKAVTVTATYQVEGTSRSELNFAAGLTPFLAIPNNALNGGDGQNVTVYWSSNLCDKNGETPTEFKVELKRGSELVDLNGDEEGTCLIVSGTAKNPASSVTISGKILEYDYGGGNNTFTVTVSARYGEKDYTATATISLESKPAQVFLNKLENYYILDTVGSVDIGWNVRNLDRASGEEMSELFKFQITKGGQEVAAVDKLELDNGAASGTVTLDDLAFNANQSDPSSYRQVYTVTLQAKNGEDSTWSYDSFLLYVYDEDALKIMVDGASENRVQMSNIAEISRMSQEQILALKRDIYLKNIISANYGEYAWTEVADQIMWKSEDSTVASVNYQQGTLYDNIEHFSYTSYRPTTDLGLSGLSDGRTTVTATHKLTGMEDSLNVQVETLKDKLYLFQCYPQAETTLTFEEYTDASKTAKKQVTLTSDETGAAAYYAQYGIASDVYCQAEKDGIQYTGTFYLNQLKTGEGDWTKLERYPCNNLQLRRAAYAYLYLKNPNGTPYTGTVTVRGGVYINGDYKEKAFFTLNGSAHPTTPGDQDTTVSLGSDGKLTVLMDQSQWGAPVKPGDRVEYVFQIETDNSKYYPILYTINATVNEEAFVSNGEAVVPFRENTESGKHPFIVAQSAYYSGFAQATSVLGSTDQIGPSSSLPEANLTTLVMWWDEEAAQSSAAGAPNTLQLYTDGSRIPIADGEGEYKCSNDGYPFSKYQITDYTVKFNEQTLKDVVGKGETAGLLLEYYWDGKTVTRQESLPFRLCNMIGVPKPEEAEELESQIGEIGNMMGTTAKDAKKDFKDEFVNIALNLVASDSYTERQGSMFSLRIAPTNDPTKFLGLMEANLGNMSDKDQVTGVYAGADTSGKSDLDYTPGLSELLTLTGEKNIYNYLLDDANKVLKRQGVRNMNFDVGGYYETLIYYDDIEMRWRATILSGGFNAGGGLSYTWNWNTVVGIVPFTASLSVGGTAEVSMDALTVEYHNKAENYNGLASDFLTQLRIYLYLRFFAGVGFDYSVVAFKLGLYGQINIDMRFQWLNRPYIKKGEVYNVADGGNDPVLDGQHFAIDGQIGLEFLVKVLFISYEKILYSYSFNLLNEATGKLDTIQENWAANKAVHKGMIDSLLKNGGMSVQNVGGQQMLSLNLAPTLEDRSYLEDEDFSRQWGEGFSLFALDEDNGLANLESSTYPYANPVVSDDGQLVTYLTDQWDTDAKATRVAYGVKRGSSYQKGDIIADAGYGDSQVVLSGTEDFAVSAWTRQMVDINKDSGAVLTPEDQMMMTNGTEVYAAVYDGRDWSSTRLSENSAPDLAPVVAASGGKALVAWRSVASSSADNLVSFDQKDTIAFKIWNGTGWSEQPVTLYNGTSGAVKGLTAEILSNGSAAAVAYTLDTDGDEESIEDREIIYAVVDLESGEVVRTVRATNDGYLDENPQLAAVTFPGDDQERFVLAWYTEQAVAQDSAEVLDGGEESSKKETIADIRLLDFDASGSPMQGLPDSISQVADGYDVAITPNFRFTKNADTISDLSILWVERAEGTLKAVSEATRSSTESGDLSALKTERDVLKGIKFYTYGQNDEMIRFTGAVDVAEMEDSTLIDHFDAYVSDPENNEIKAVILGTTYGKDGATETRIVTLADPEGTQAQVTVPKRTSAMYTATETYADKIAVPAVLADYATVKLGSKTQILFTIENRGIHAIEQLDINVGNTPTTYKDLNLLPGDTIQLYGDYQVPGDRVVDPTYTVTATFDSEIGASGEAKTRTGGFFGGEDLNQATGTIYLDRPDIEVTNAEIVKEEDGQRVIQIKLNNASAAALAGSDRTVRLNFYTDATYEKAMLGMDDVVIADRTDLDMIDNGGYSTQVAFEIANYLEEVNQDIEADKKLTELPANGVPIYIKAEILQPKESKSSEMVPAPEPMTSNNFGNVTAENLAVRTGKDAVITSTLSSDGSSTTVAVTVQNTRYAQTTTGNIIVTLLDADGKVLGQQQSYTGAVDNNGLLTLGSEEKCTKEFVFDGLQGASVQVTYSDLILHVPSEELVSLTFSNIQGITLDSFVLNANTGNYEATVVTDDLTATTVMASAKSATAVIAVTTDIVQIFDEQSGSNAVSRTVTLQPGQVNTITVTVTDGEKTRTYVLTVQNNGEPVIDQPTGTPGENPDFSASVVYNGKENATITLTAAAKPAPDSYQLSYQWYQCDVEGKNLAELDQAAGFTGTNTSELTVPNTIDAGVHYYRCRVSRPLVGGGTKEYWSSVASVEITKAAGNSVDASNSRVVVDYDGQEHTINLPTAEKTGSTLLYTTTPEKPDSWSTERPAFVNVGVHTVWIKATHKNYQDTQPVTADVLIQGTPEVSAPTVQIDSQFGSNVVYGKEGSATITVEGTKNPPDATYELAYQWYTCDAQGSEDSRKKMEGENKNTLKIPSTTPAGTHYYICEVSRTLVDGSKTESVWSTVASVTIDKSDANAVRVEGQTVTFDNTGHGLNSVAATQEGSTIWYSTDAGENWSKTAPKFTAVGTHQIWVKATHANYLDTEVAVGTVIIQADVNTQFKLEAQTVAEKFDSYPETIKKKYGSAEKLEAAMKAEVVKLGASEKNTQIYDVKLLFSLDGGKTWNEATADNFPAAGVTVRLPYPDGTNQYGYNFTLLHMITDPLNTGKTVGAIETMDVTLEKDGIRFTTDCLSPFALGWERRPSSPTRYAVTERDTEHGSFSAKPARAERGETVTITTKPDAGYQVASVTVTTQSGKKLSVEQTGTNRYTFKMPDRSVYVEVKFEKQAHWTNPFVDVSGDAWYYDAVKYVNENGLMAGTSANTFAPDLTTTRGMIVTILYRLEGSPDIGSEILGYPFRDVDADAWYATAVYWARMNGIVAGYSNELFGPNDTITREQMATILYRYARYKGCDTTAKADLSRYTDAAQVGPWAAEAIRWANAEGLVNGTSATTLAPKGSATRAQVAVILTRFCQNNAK